MYLIFYQFITTIHKFIHNLSNLTLQYTFLNYVITHTIYIYIYIYIFRANGLC